MRSISSRLVLVLVLYGKSNPKKIINGWVVFSYQNIRFSHHTFIFKNDILTLLGSKIV
jgi:hypothetical protein